jgi:hypothetical protein
MDHAADAMRTDLMTITRHVLNEQSKFPEARGDLTILLNNIVLGCKFVCSSVSKVWSLSLVLVNSAGDVYHIVALLELVCVIASSKIYCLSYCRYTFLLIPYGHGLLAHSVTGSAE